MALCVARWLGFKLRLCCLLLLLLLLLLLRAVTGR
jgi:hypothetical protein